MAEKVERCPFCHGTGRCEKCSGTGKRLIRRPWPFRNKNVDCWVCRGTGRCELCHGHGHGQQEELS